MRTSKSEYAAFEEKVKRTLYLDNISPQTVKTVWFIPNYLESRNVPHCALVEMENPKQASVIGKEITEFRFMILGIPRPVRAHSAAANMFDEHPPEDPNFEVQTVEGFLRKKQLEEEEKLAKLQSEAFKAHYKKYERVDSVMSDGTARRLSHTIIKFEWQTIDDRVFTINY
ncbi:hypothetical protein D8674_017204 [Pyrus ussuriensis x Pyrus communis]|uniref:Uncharacterized protein n=1 Tax=Pyrus ussuriensis x Pyrus communis TaxID=2448454 RepID=A0A5N5HQF3_9ROSA|nr:hypothetical protein D8674_017204 [Pyrus ussuriensis x Pyrus communis]